ncbi:MAG: hypothetical protein PHW69_04980 [Elusimicrobiaceae bacterium]|nr:hypothetical protein [Elusimicrobiaceae bacterium]
MQPEMVKLLVIASLFVFAGLCVYGVAKFIRAWKGYKSTSDDIDPSLLAAVPEPTPAQAADLQARRFIEQTRQLDSARPDEPAPARTELSQDALQFAVNPPKTPPRQAEKPRTQEYKNDAERQLFSD